MYQKACVSVFRSALGGEVSCKFYFIVSWDNDSSLNFRSEQRMLRKLVEEKDRSSSGDLIYFIPDKPRSFPTATITAAIITIVMASALILVLLGATMLVPWSSQALNENGLESGVVRFLIHEQQEQLDFKGAADMNPLKNDDSSEDDGTSRGGLQGHLSSSDQPQLWAVLVAGSNGFYNYRHQVK